MFNNFFSVFNRSSSKPSAGRVVATEITTGPAPATVDRVAQFNELMRTSAVTVCNEIEVGHTGYLDRPVAGKLFAGKDDHGRVFVNLPLYIDESPTVTAMRTANGRRKSNSEGFVFFQRYTDNNRVFVTGGSCEAAQYFTCDDEGFERLRLLLDGGTLRFYPTVWSKDGGDFVNDRNHWIDVSLASAAD